MVLIFFHRSERVGKRPSIFWLSAGILRGGNLPSQILARSPELPQSKRQDQANQRESCFGNELGNGPNGSCGDAVGAIYQRS